MNRRAVLKGGLILAATAHRAAGAPEIKRSGEERLSVDAFLAIATPAEKVRYHSNALMEALAEMHPAHNGWRCHADHEHAFVLVAPNPYRQGFMFQDTGKMVEA